MNFCIISPAAGLKQFATLSTTHLVLSHITDSAYMSFYRERRDAGQGGTAALAGREPGHRDVTQPPIEAQSLQHARRPVAVVP